jgi:hypothetical protein
VLSREPIVAVALLTQREVTALGPAFKRLWPIDQAPEFADLLRAIDDAERKLQHDKESPHRTP